VTTGPRSAISATDLALVAVGGAVGASLRWAVLATIGISGGFPWWTLVVNVVGCLGLGLLVRAERSAGLGLGTGLCGGLTTFSTFSVEVAELLDQGRAVVAAGYVGASLVLGLAAVLAGRWLVSSDPDPLAPGATAVNT